ncbi:MAG: LacI family DNA-binding transcriptional regulator [Bauldia sp.]
MSTIRDVARLAGVSTATVSATLSGTAFVSEPLRARVREAVEELDYSPHGVARSLKSGSTRLIGLVIPDVTNPFFTEFVHAFGALARGDGYSMLLGVTGFDAAREREAIALLRMQRVDGIIACPGANADPYNESFAIGSRPAVVLVDNVPVGVNVDSVVLDNYAAAFVATTYLLDRGHVRVATVTGPSVSLPGRERIRGFQAALAARGIPFDPRYVVSGNFLEEDSRRALGDLLSLDPRPSAIFAAGNLMLVGVMRGLHEAGLSVPTDISVAAVDDFPWATAFRPALTTVCQPVAAMAEHAMRLLRARIAGDVSPPTRIELSASLVIRDSVAGLPQAAF